MPVISGGSGGVRAATVVLTNAQILALPSTPIVVVPATQVNIATIPASLPAPLAVYAYLNATAGAYTNINAGARLGLYYSSIAEVEVLRDTSGGMAATLASPDITECFQHPVYQITEISSGSVSQDNALSLALFNSAAGNLTGGNAANTLRLVVVYTQITIA